MTKAQTLIKRLLEEGRDTNYICSHTGKHKTYVSKIRRLLETEPDYFETTTLINRAYKEYERLKPQGKQLDRKHRECLGCGRTFESLWVGNRICGKCRGNEMAEGYRNAGYTARKNSQGDIWR